MMSAVELVAFLVVTFVSEAYIVGCLVLALLTNALALPLALSLSLSLSLSLLPLQATLELEGMKGLWSLRKTSTAEFDTFLVVTFVSETRILAINEEDELEEFDFPGFNSDAQTLLTSNVAHDQIIQVGRRALAAAGFPFCEPLCRVDISSRERVKVAA